jgi:putative transposase
MSSGLEIKLGAIVGYQGEKASILALLNLTDAQIQLHSNKEIKPVKIRHLTNPPHSVDTPIKTPDIALLSDKDWQEAQRRFSIIRPILERNDQKAKDVVLEVCQRHDVDRATIYRWIGLYQRTGRISSLAPLKRGIQTGEKKLNQKAEEVIQTVIKEYYLTKQKPSVQKTIDTVNLYCHRAKIDSPHPNTVRNRIHEITKYKSRLERLGTNASLKHRPIYGSIRGADYPLAIVEIDHTKMDVILVDETYRRPIGRPYVTLAIDVFSRVILGFYISLDAPGDLAVGMCLTHAILPKEIWLTQKGITAEWPCWGVMRCIHLDNAKEFRGNLLRRACAEYGIDIHWRPSKKPQYGAHIERLMGTCANELKTLKGATFSNTQQKGEYNSEKEANMTLEELELWIVTYITGEYHNKVHATLKVSPLIKFEQGVFGHGDTPGIGFPLKVFSEEKVRLDFLPAIERSIQNYGVIIDHISYYSDILRPYIDATEGNLEKSSREKFIFKRDPRDISRIYFLDPEHKEYKEIPYSNAGRPAMSLWEAREAHRQLIAEGKKHIDEDAIFESREKRLLIETQAAQKTKSVRREMQRRLNHEKTRKTSPKTGTPTTMLLSDRFPDSTIEIKPFEEIE